MSKYPTLSEFLEVARPINARHLAGQKLSDQDVLTALSNLDMAVTFAMLEKHPKEKAIHNAAKEFAALAKERNLWMECLAKY